MKRAILLALLLSCAPSTVSCTGKAARKPVALILLGEWFGDSYFPLKEKLEGWEWTLLRAGVDTTYLGCYNRDRDVEMRTDVFLADVEDFSPYDCLIIPGGPQFRRFNTDETVLRFIRDAHGAGLVVASFCTGNFLVNAAGLVEIPRPLNLREPVLRPGENILMGRRGGGPPPGNGFEGAPIGEICEALANMLNFPIPEEEEGRR